MMRKYTLTAAAVIGLSSGLFVTGVTHAEQDFTRYTNEEMVQQRNRINAMEQGERARYEQEWQKRLGATNQEAQPANQERLRINEDNDQGRGELTRERTRIENGNGYGRGFNSRHGATGGGRGR
ncbi:MAG: hypothetical protein GC149_18215 [Gammaproteobacteria bacterium]|nr:hypothetical protein [Gammaproteobacteria bacterium]